MTTSGGNFFTHTIYALGGHQISVHCLLIVVVVLQVAAVTSGVSVVRAREKIDLAVVPVTLPAKQGILFKF